MDKIQGINSIAVAQNFVMAQKSEELLEAMKAIHCNCLTQPVDAIRDFAKHLEVVTKATLMDRVRENVKNGNCAENVSAALEDVENLVNPVLSAPIISIEARQLSLDVKYLSSLDEYYNQRVDMLDEIQDLTGEEAEAISGHLVERLGDLLIFEVLVDNADGDKILSRQVRLWQMFHIAREEGQMQLVPYFLALDEEDNVHSLLPYCLPLGSPARVFYSCAGILKVLAYQQDVWEYDGLVNALYKKVQTEVEQRIRRGKDDEDTRMLGELFSLLRMIVNTHSPIFWDCSRFEEIIKKLEGN